MKRKNVIPFLYLIFFLFLISCSTESITSSHWTKVASGDLFCVAIKDDGTLWTWGTNSHGDLGNGSISAASTNVPVQISSEHWTWVSAGLTHAGAIKADGTLWMWGGNYVNQLGDSTSVDKYLPVQESTGAHNWVMVSCGYEYTAAIKSDGTLWAWGYNYAGQLGDGTTTSRNIPTQIGSGNNWIHVSCGLSHTMALKTDGSLWAWGNNGYGQIGDGTSTNRLSPVGITGGPWMTVDAGDGFSLGIKSNGTLWTWGYNYSGQLGDGTNTNKSTPNQVGTTSNWVKGQAGNAYIIGVKADGSLWTCGWNTYGQLGDGTTASKNTPIQVGTSSDWSIGYDSWGDNALAQKNDGTLWIWGGGGYGTIGNGSYDSQLIPVVVP